MEFYTWKIYRCAFEHVAGKPPERPSQVDELQSGQTTLSSPALLLIHPVGVGLSRRFWHPFIQRWQANHEPHSAIYNMDLLGCGDSDMPQRAYTPEDWAKQLAYFIEQVAQEPVVLVVQGALLPVALRLVALAKPENIKGMVLSGPPAWRLMSTPTESWKQTLAWSLFSSPLGNVFYRYARREKFLSSFSERQLFEQSEDVSDDWLSALHTGSRNMNSRYAVFSFLAGFWRQDYTQAIAQVQQPVLIVMGNKASSIDRQSAQAERDRSKASPAEEHAPPVSAVSDEQPTASSQQRLQSYLERFPQAQGICIPGRNVMPYESPDAFIKAISPFISNLQRP